MVIVTVQAVQRPYGIWALGVGDLEFMREVLGYIRMQGWGCVLSAVQSRSMRVC